MKQIKTNEEKQEERKKYLSEMIEFEKDIKPYPVTLILSGVGSGKTTYIRDLANGSISGAEDLRFCFVTNRKNRVNQTIFDVYDDDKSINLFIENLYYKGNLYEPGMGQMISAIGYDCMPEEIMKYRRINRLVGDTFNQNACVTNAKFGSFLSKLYKKFGEKNPEAVYNLLLDLFDIFVFDEIHAINTDTGYQEAPFYIWKFIEGFSKRGEDDRNKHIILMTGTIGPLGAMLNKIRRLKIIDMKHKCTQVVPDHIEFITRKQMLQEIGIYTTINIKNVLCFYSGGIKDVDYFCKDNGANQEVMMTYYSEYNPRWLNVGTTEEEIKKYADEHMKISQFRCALIDKDETKRGRFPEGIHFVATTSCLMEGVDLYDVDIVYICAHNITEVVQMAGRVRSGGHIVKIVVDSQEFMMYDDFINEENISKQEKALLPEINKEFNNLKSFEDKLSYIENFANSGYGYILFNYIDGEFQFYESKRIGIEYYKNAFFKWHKLNSQGIRMGDMVPDYYKKIVQEWFPGVEVKEFKSKPYLAREMIRTALKPRKHGERINIAVYNKLLAELCILYGESHHMKWFLDQTGIKGRFVRKDGRRSYYVFEGQTQKTEKSK